MTALDLLPLVMLGAVLGLDVVSFPQAMISRPLIAASLAGILVGQPALGLLAGAILEMFALETLPIGASRYPEWGSASVVGGALFAAQPTAPPGSLAVAVLGALAVAWVGGHSMVGMRRLNARWARTRRDQLEAGDHRTVVGLQLLGLTADLFRGGALTLLGLLVLRPLHEASVSLWLTDARISRAVVVGLAATVAAAAMWKIFHLTPGARVLLVVGLVVGVSMLAIV